jgi:acetyltransferase-like isoleucine patch superfamily enzyme
MVTGAANDLVRSLREFVREPTRRAKLRSRVMQPLWRRRFHSFGRGSILDLPTWIYGPHLISIGRGCIILRGAWLAVERPIWGRTDPALRIGHGVALMPNCTISASQSIVIEDYVVLATGCSVVDSDHTHGSSIAHDRPGYHESVLFNPVTTAPIRIGRGTWMGARVAVLPGADVGRHCSIGANSVVRGTIPDYSVAVGVPARVVGSTRLD